MPVRLLWLFLAIFAVHGFHSEMATTEEGRSSLEDLESSGNAAASAQIAPTNRRLLGIEKYKKMPGVFLDAGVEKETVQTLSQCAQTCDNEKTCKSFSYSGALQACYPVSHRLQMNPNFSLYVKKASGGYEEMKYMVAAGHDTKTVSRVSKTHCEELCDENIHCKAYSYRILNHDEGQATCIVSKFSVEMNGKFDYYDAGSEGATIPVPSSGVFVSSKSKDSASDGAWRGRVGSRGADKVAAAAVNVKAVLLKQKLRLLTKEAVGLESNARKERIKAAKLHRSAQRKARDHNARVQRMFAADLKLEEDKIRRNVTASERGFKSHIKLEFANQELKDMVREGLKHDALRKGKQLSKEAVVEQEAAATQGIANQTAMAKLTTAVGQQAANDKSLSLQDRVAALDKDLVQTKRERDKIKLLEVETSKSHKMTLRNQQIKYEHQLKAIQDHLIVRATNAQIAEKQRLSVIQENLELQEKMREKQANVRITQQTLDKEAADELQLRKTEQAAATERDKIKKSNEELLRATSAEDNVNDRVRAIEERVVQIKINSEAELGEEKNRAEKTLGKLQTALLNNLTKIRHVTDLQLLEIKMKLHNATEEALEKEDIYKEQKLKTDASDIENKLHLELLEARNLSAKTKFKRDTLEERLANATQLAASLAQSDKLAELAALKNVTGAIIQGKKDLRQEVKDAVKLAQSNLSTVKKNTIEAGTRIMEEGKILAGKAKARVNKEIDYALTKYILKLKSIEVVPVDYTIKIMPKPSPPPPPPVDISATATISIPEPPAPQILTLHRGASRLKKIPDELAAFSLKNEISITSINQLFARIQELKKFQSNVSKRDVVIRDDNSKAAIDSAILVEERRQAMLQAANGRRMFQRRHLLQVQNDVLLLDLMDSIDDTMGSWNQIGNNSLTESPTKAPTKSPSKASTKIPTKSPTMSPTESPTKAPTKSPSKAPTKSPTSTPSVAPTNSPTDAPSFAPTLEPTDASRHPEVIARSKKLKEKLTRRKQEVNQRIQERSEKISHTQAERGEKMKFGQHAFEEQDAKFTAKRDLEDRQISKEKDAKLEHQKSWEEQKRIVNDAVMKLTNELKKERMSVATTTETMEYLEQERETILTSPAYTPLGAIPQIEDKTCKLRAKGVQTMEQGFMLRISTDGLFPEDEILGISSLHIFKAAGSSGELKVQGHPCAWSSKNLSAVSTDHQCREEGSVAASLCGQAMSSLVAIPQKSWLWLDVPLTTSGLKKAKNLGQRDFCFLVTGGPTHAASPAVQIITSGSRRPYLDVTVIRGDKAREKVLKAEALKRAAEEKERQRLALLPPTNAPTNAPFTSAPTNGPNMTGANWCGNGILREGKPAICCASSCGTCGGRGCHTRAGGPQKCCHKKIKNSRVSCRDAGPPCVVPNSTGAFGGGPTVSSTVSPSSSPTTVSPSSPPTTAPTRSIWHHKMYGKFFNETWLELFPEYHKELRFEINRRVKLNSADAIFWAVNKAFPAAFKVARQKAGSVWGAQLSALKHEVKISLRKKLMPDILASLTQKWTRKLTRQMNTRLKQISEAKAMMKLEQADMERQAHKLKQATTQNITNVTNQTIHSSFMAKSYQVRN